MDSNWEIVLPTKIILPTAIEIAPWDTMVGDTVHSIRTLEMARLYRERRLFQVNISGKEYFTESLRGYKVPQKSLCNGFPSREPCGNSQAEAEDKASVIICNDQQLLTIY